MASSDMSHDNLFIKEVAIHGHNLTQQLASHLGRPGTDELCISLAQAVLAMWEQLMPMAIAVESDGELPMAKGEPKVETNLSRTASPQKRPFKDQEDRQEMNKKRKNLPTWTRQVKVQPGKGLEGAIEDGFTWRKYGQKSILRSAHPRGYYRCTHRFTQGCPATKKVQRSEENPTVFDVNYQGHHTCTQKTPLPPKAPSPAAAANGNPQGQPNPVNADMNNLLLMNLKANLRVETEGLENSNPEFCSPFSLTPTNAALSEYGLICTPSPMIGGSFRRNFSPFVSPAPSESNYFSSSPFASENAGDFLNESEADFVEIISTMASACSSPKQELDCQAEDEAVLEQSDFDLAAYFNWN